MRIRLASRQWTFEEGDVSLVRGFVDPRVAEESHAVVRANEIENFANVAHGEVTLFCHSCLVRSNTTDFTYRIPLVVLESSIAEEHIIGDTAQISVGFHAIARIEAFGQDEKPLTREHMLGIALPGISIEVQGPQNSPLYVLLPAGEYVAYMTESSLARRHFSVDGSEEDIGTVRLYPV